MSAAEPGDVRVSRYVRIVEFLGLALMSGLLLTLGMHLFDYFKYARKAIRFPFGLDYGEGIVWQQALLMPGPKMYGDITQYPFIVFHYTPLYHLVVRAIAAIGFDFLAVGRTVSFASTFAIAAFVGGITVNVVRKRVSVVAAIVGATVSGLLVFTYQPVEYWAVLLRVDMLAVALSMAGVYVAVIGLPRTANLYAATLLFVAAIYTKQTEIPGPAAVFFVTALVSPRSAWKAALFGLVFGGIAFATLQLDTQGGFWRHIFDYNINRFSLGAAIVRIREQEQHAAALLVSIVALALSWWMEYRMSGRLHRAFRTWLRASDQARALAIISLWLLFASAMLLMVGKSGAAPNYFIEWMCVLAVPIGVMASYLWDVSLGSTPGLSLFVLRGAALMLPISMMYYVTQVPTLKVDLVTSPDAAAFRSQLVSRIRSSMKPVISSDMVLLLRAGKPIPIEPKIFAELAAADAWDQQPFLDMIGRREFGFVITQKGADHFTPKMIDAIEAGYPAVERIEDYVLHRPVE